MPGTPRRRRPPLWARFDTQALQAFDPAAAPQRCQWPALQRWCPPGTPTILPRLAIAVCDAPDPDAAAAQAAAWGLQLDGTRALLARGALGAAALRLRVQLQDAAAALAGRSHGIWDSGRVVDAPAVWQALARWQPRRASFLLVHAAPALPGTLQVMAERSASFVHPVRVLVLGSAHNEAPDRALWAARDAWAGVDCTVLPPMRG